MLQLRARCFRIAAALAALAATAAAFGAPLKWH
jgi:hypothetical protein